MDLFSIPSNKNYFRSIEPDIKDDVYGYIQLFNTIEFPMYFEIYKSAANKSGSTNLLEEANPSWSWRLKGANHKLVASGESYKNETDCLRAIELVKGTNSSTLVTEL